MTHSRIMCFALFSFYMLFFSASFLFHCFTSFMLMTDKYIFPMIHFPNDSDIVDPPLWMSHRTECLCSLKIPKWIPNPHVMVFGGGAFEDLLGWKAGAHRNGTSPHEEEARGLVSSLSTVWGHNKITLCKPGRGHSLRALLCRHPDLGFPASKTVRNKCLFFKATQSLEMCYSSPNWLK